MIVLRNKLILMVLLLGLAIVGVQAQVPEDGLIAYRNGDLWLWSDDMPAGALTDTGYHSGPVISPDGSKIAFLRWTDETITTFEAQEFPGPYGSMAANIFVLERGSSVVTQVADQTGAGPNGIVRSYPVWSPDGMELAWSELNSDASFNGTAKLVVYNMASGQQRVLNANYDLGYQDVALFMPPVDWAEGGISRIVTTFPQDAAQPQELLEIYDPQTGALSVFPLGTGNPGYVWFQDEGVNKIALLNSDGSWSSLDPAAGVLAPMANAPVLQLQNGTGLTLQPIVQLENGNFSGVQWQANYNGATLTLPVEGGFGLSATRANFPIIAPDGQRVAWMTFEQEVKVWDAATQSVETVIPALEGDALIYITPQSIVWSAMQWAMDTAPARTVVQLVTATPMVRAEQVVTATPQPAVQVVTATPQPATAAPVINVPAGFECDAYGPSFNIGDRFVVPFVDGPKTVYKDPNRAPILGNVLEGRGGVILEGPECAGGREGFLVTWFVETDTGVEGWISEGYSPGSPWIVPEGSVDVSSPPDIVRRETVPESFDCPGAYGPNLAVGDRFVVPFGDGATRAFRSPNREPSTGDIYEGQGGIILDGPVCNAGRSGNLVVWYVRADSGVEGWVGEGYFSSPVPWIVRE